MTNPTLLDYLSQNKSSKEDKKRHKLKGTRSSKVNVSLPVSKIKISERRKGNKSINKSTLSRKMPKNEKIKHMNKNHLVPSTRWTDEQWKKYYLSITDESPSHLIEKASKIDDDGIKILLDLVINGDPYDKRRKEDKNKDGKYRLDPMNWHLLCELARAVKRLEK
ncbi:MAG: hypothetical protein QW292_13715 [Candidatus Parvarchaeota archaeon]